MKTHATNESKDNLFNKLGTRPVVIALALSQDVVLPPLEQDTECNT